MYAPTVSNIDPKDANFVSFNAPMIYFPLPRSNIPPAPIIPILDAILPRGGGRCWDDEKIRTYSGKVSCTTEKVGVHYTNCGHYGR